MKVSWYWTANCLVGARKNILPLNNSSLAAGTSINPRNLESYTRVATMVFPRPVGDTTMVLDLEADVTMLT